MVKWAQCRESDTQTPKDCQLRNLWEFLVWHHSKGQPEHELLMPCKDIHPEGKWLTMRKGTRVDKQELSNIKTKTTWVGDRKKENFAKVNDKILMVDYGVANAVEHLGLPMEFKPAVQAVQKILNKHNISYNNPNYGKSKPQQDPLDSD